MTIQWQQRHRKVLNGANTVLHGIDHYWHKIRSDGKEATIKIILDSLDISCIEQLNLLLPSGHEALQLPPSSMGILLHGSCRPIEVLLVEELRDGIQVATA